MENKSDRPPAPPPAIPDPRFQLPSTLLLPQKPVAPTPPPAIPAPPVLSPAPPTGTGSGSELSKNDTGVNNNVPMEDNVETNDSFPESRAGKDSGNEDGGALC
ncbi:Uncharacterized protein Fot_24046 [Forsythia ovata]|uniref:Uncharacterized protein n=1 Tax=Forsythia ovata TaxID=205694 RepID=A0ABD1U544_9LAMI